MSLTPRNHYRLFTYNDPRLDHYDIWPPGYSVFQSAYFFGHF